MNWLKTAGKMIFLGILAFGVAAGVGATDLRDSYAFSLAISVVLCPALLGFAGGRWLGLGPIATLAGIEFLPVVMALDSRFHLGEPTGFGWLLSSFVFAWVGWRMSGRLKKLKSEDL